MKLIRWLILGASLLCACPANQARAPDRTGLSDPVKQGSVQAAGATDSGGPPALNQAPSGPPISVVFRFVNAADQPRYLSYARFWLEEFNIERREGETWVRVDYDLPMGDDYLCPTDGSPPNCQPFMPMTPFPTIQPMTPREYTWNGMNNEYQEISRSCGCYRPQPVPPGRYRARLCLYPGYNCIEPPCQPGQNDEIQGALGSGTQVCPELEFDLTGTDQTVIFEIPGEAPATP